MLERWMFWSVPVDWAGTYIFRLILWMFVIPTLLGVQLTIAGYFIQFLVIDFFTYLSLRTN